MIGYQVSSKYELDKHPRTAISRICVPFNFSDCAYTGLNYAARFARLINAELTILHCFQSTNLKSNSSTDVEYATSTYERKREILEKVPLLGELNCTFTVEHTYLTEILPALSSQGEIDMVLLGTQISGKRETIFGTNASSLINRITVPLLIVPDDLKQIRLKNILFATDHKDFEDLTKFLPLKAIINMVDAKLHIVHVSPPGKEANSKGNKIEDRLKHFFEGIEMEIHSADHTNIHKGLHSFSAGNDIDMITMVPRKHGLLESLYHPSETKKMAMDTKLPLLVFHE